MINVIFALTNYGKSEAIYKQTAYYPAVIAHFSPYKNHLAVRTIDSLLTRSEDLYAPLKMDSYAYRFAGDKIQNGGVYDRVSWGEVNELAPYIPLLEQFANQQRVLQKSNRGFSKIYRRSNYENLVRETVPNNALFGGQGALFSISRLESVGQSV